VSPSPDFDSLLAAARQGAEWAWTQVYREYSPAVLRYLKARGAREPEDLLGEVFVQVVRNLPAFRGGERDFRTWIFLIARNRLTDERRLAGRSQVDVAADEALSEIVDPRGTDEAALARLDHERVMRVLGELTPDQRDVVFLRVLAQLSIEETARVLGKRPGAVKALQHRALEAIRRGFSR
jgi:RNA polymerase sigma-70 factor (ECF subfamily)